MGLYTEKNRLNYERNRDWWKTYYETHREEILLKKKEGWINDPLSKKKARDEKHKQYLLNPEKFKEKRKKWYRENIDKVVASRNLPKNKISTNISRGIRQSLTRGKNGYAWELLLGYTTKDLMNHLESKFKNGMTWENYGEWEIDHIIPISAHKYESINDEDFKKCWAFTNLQPLWMKENRSKFNKIER